MNAYLKGTTFKLLRSFAGRLFTFGSLTKLYHSEIKQRLRDSQFERYLKELPADISNKIRKFRRWEDAHASLFGKLLLKNGLTAFGHNADLLNLRYTAYGRPYLQDCVDFNISHSGHHVVCALISSGKVGIDIEQIKPIELTDFGDQWTKAEWKFITTSADPYREFYNQWTRKEAIIKADGKGLSIPLQEISVMEDTVILDNKHWYLQKIDLSPQYILHVATDIPVSIGTIEKYEF